MKKYIFLTIASFLVQFSFAQPKEFSPRYFLDKDSTLYWNKKLPVYIKLSSTPDEPGVNLVNKEFEQYTNPVYFDTEGPNYIRTRYAVDKDTREVKTPKTEVLFEVISDGLAPMSTITFVNAPHHTNNDQDYYGKGLLFELKASDKYSGVQNIYTAIDGDQYLDYQSPISLLKEGPHTIKYFSTDRVNNAESIQTTTIIVDTSAPIITYNINGVSEGNTLAGSSTFYLTATDNISGVLKSFYRFDDQAYLQYGGNKLNLTHLEDGPHSIEYYAEDQVGNISNFDKFDFYYDKLAPLTATDILGDKFLYQDKVYFSGRTKMKLTAIDNKAGVKEIKYSIDNGNFISYEEPFYLPSIQGNHVIKFYSVDRLSNQPSGAEEYKHNINLVFLDLTGPDLNHTISGPSFNSANDLYIGPQTNIHLSATDLQSGLQYISYSLDGAQAETRYEKPFQLKTTSGSHKIEMFGYDNVNNRNINQLTVLYDNNPPKILPNFSVGPVGEKEGLQVYPKHLVLFLAATDEMVGNDKIYYQLNSAPEQLYNSPISSWQAGKKYELKIRAIDKVGNESNQTISFDIAEK